MSDLARWRDINDHRNEYVMWADMVGIPKMEIHRITGLARGTIDRIINGGDGDE